MIRESIRLVSAIAVGLFLFAGAAQAQDLATIRVASFMSTESPIINGILRPFFDRVVADSKGTLKVSYILGGALGKNPSEQYKLVADGVADSTVVIPAYTPGFLTDYSVVEIPGVVNDSVSGSIALWNGLDKGVLRKPEGVVVLGLLAAVPNVIHLNGKKDGALDSLKGMKIRAVGKSQVAVLQALGAGPVTGLRITEVAEAASRGTIDGALMDYAANVAERVSEVTKTHIEVPMGSVVIMFAMNKSAYDRLPGPALEALNKHMGLAFSTAAGEALDKSVAKFRQQLVERGDTFVQPKRTDLDAYNQGVAVAEKDWRAGGDANAKLLSSYRDLVSAAAK